jgi:hypothetical protein
MGDRLLDQHEVEMNGLYEDLVHHCQRKILWLSYHHYENLECYLNAFHDDRELQKNCVVAVVAVYLQTVHHLFHHEILLL